GDTPKRRSRRLAGQEPEVHTLPVPIPTSGNTRGIPAGFVRQARRLFQAAEPVHTSQTAGNPVPELTKALPTALATQGPAPEADCAPAAIMGQASTVDPASPVPPMHAQTPQAVVTAHPAAPEPAQCPITLPVITENPESPSAAISSAPVPHLHPSPHHEVAENGTPLAQNAAGAQPAPSAALPAVHSVPNAPADPSDPVRGHTVPSQTPQPAPEASDAHQEQGKPPHPHSPVHPTTSSTARHGESPSSLAPPLPEPHPPEPTYLATPFGVHGSVALPAITPNPATQPHGPSPDPNQPAKRPALIPSAPLTNPHTPAHEDSPFLADPAQTGVPGSTSTPLAPADLVLLDPLTSSGGVLASRHPTQLLLRLLASAPLIKGEKYLPSSPTSPPSSPLRPKALAAPQTMPPAPLAPGSGFASPPDRSGTKMEDEAKNTLSHHADAMHTLAAIAANEAPATPSPSARTHAPSPTTPDPASTAQPAPLTPRTPGRYTARRTPANLHRLVVPPGTTLGVHRSAAADDKGPLLERFLSDGEEEPFHTPLTHPPHTPHTFRDNTRPRAELAHRSAKTPATSPSPPAAPLGVTKTVAFKVNTRASSPPLTRSKARAAAVLAAAIETINREVSLSAPGSSRSPADPSIAPAAMGHGNPSNASSPCSWHEEVVTPSTEHYAEYPLPPAFSSDEDENPPPRREHPPADPMTDNNPAPCADPYAYLFEEGAEGGEEEEHMPEDSELETPSQIIANLRIPYRRVLPRPSLFRPYPSYRLPSGAHLTL
ncbi:hypothetical protein HDU96_003276, partial [Phlyctochytrium bullatum]